MTKPERMEVPYYASILYLVRFVAEALGAFVETFPRSDRVLTFNVKMKFTAVACPSLTVTVSVSTV